MIIKSFFFVIGLISLVHADVSSESQNIVGVLSTENIAKISSEIGGQILLMPFKPGDSFKKGETLVVFDCKQIEYERDAAKANLDIAKADLKGKEILKKDKAVSQFEYEKALGTFNKTEADLNGFENKLKKCTIQAPYAGTVISNEAKVFEIVKTDDPVLSIVNNISLDVKFYLPSEMLSRIQIGTRFFLKLSEYSDLEFRGTVTEIIPHIDPASQMLLLYGKLIDAPSYLFTGMSGTIRLDGRKSVS